MMRAARLRRPTGGWATALVAMLLLALLLWSVVYPNAAIIVGSFERGLGDWRDFIASPADRDALWGTVVVSIGSVIGALLIGEGTSEIQRMVIGRKLLQRHKL